MKYFQEPFVLTFLMLGVVVIIAKILHVLIKPLHKYQIPISITAGLVGLSLGSSALNILPFDADILKSIVYHGLALVFIAMGLQSVPKNSGGSDVKSIAFGLSVMGALQGFVGVSVVAILGLLLGEAIHPGLGLLLPLGFSQGPGQALTFGTSWEAIGLTNGGDIGIIIASLGFAWSIVIGIPLVIYGRKKGWMKNDAISTKEQKETHQIKDILEQVALIAGTYFLTYLLLMGVTELLAGKEKVITLFWGIHFLVALLVATIVRVVIQRVAPSQISDIQQGQLANLIIDITACSGIAAIQIRVLQDNLLPIALITTFGGLMTLVAAPWLASRSFQKDPFCHLVLWFGTSTGTLPMGLALLRMIDPDLNSTAPTSVIRAMGLALVLFVPMIILLTYIVNQWPAGYPQTWWVAMGGLLLYAIILLIGWRFFGNLRFRKGSWWSRTSDS